MHAFGGESMSRYITSLKNYYFTFGTDELFPYERGFLIVKASDMKAAIKKFNQKHPPIRGEIINCSDYYEEDQFKRYFGDENLGAGCHEVIQ